MTDHGILIVTEICNGKIHKVAFELLNKARQLAEKNGDMVCCLVLAACEKVPAAAGGAAYDGALTDCKPAAGEIARDAASNDGRLAALASDLGELCYRGADRVYLMEDKGFEYPQEALFAFNITEFIKEKKPATVLVGATNFGRSLAPRIAAALKTGLTADCTELIMSEDGELEQVRPAFSDNILAHIKTARRPQMATVRYKEFEEAQHDSSRKPEIIKIKAYKNCDPDTAVEAVLSLEEADITEAQLIVAGGKGIKKQEDLEMLKELADVLGGTIGVSRALVDMGMAPSAIQVGYSGNRVKPKVYIACGISGAPQHLAGMKEAELIIAINSDASAPIFKVADIGIVGDLYEIVPQMIERFKGVKQ